MPKESKGKKLKEDDVMDVTDGMIIQENRFEEEPSEANNESRILSSLQRDNVPPEEQRRSGGPAPANYEHPLPTPSQSAQIPMTPKDDSLPPDESDDEIEMPSMTAGMASSRMDIVRGSTSQNESQIQSQSQAPQGEKPDPPRKQVKFQQESSVIEPREAGWKVIRSESKGEAVERSHKAKNKAGAIRDRCLNDFRDFEPPTS